MAGTESKRIVFLCSGGGGNLRFVLHAIRAGWIGNAVVAAVFTDRDCPANAVAAAQEIPHRVLEFKDPGQRQLVDALAAAEPDLVVTTVHRILGPSIVEQYRGRLLNLHYSLLPAFGGAIGARPVQAALAHGARFTGVTAHEVDETVDGGRPVVQAAIPLRDEEELDQLMNVVFRCGCIALTSAIAVRLSGASPQPESVVSVQDRLCCFSAPGSVPDAAIRDESFWAAIAQTPAKASRA